MDNTKHTSFDQLRMLECLSLAEKGAGHVSPNPMVGAVVTRDGKVVGKGYHKRFGGPHAEVFAIRQAGRAAKGGTLYVNLEPCSFFGKTPPCTDVIIKAGIKRVVVGTKDLNPLVNGKGIRKLRSAHLLVETGVLERECMKLNEAFLKFIRTGKPFVTLKIAQTVDGKIADSRGNSKWLSNVYSRKLVHLLRSRYDAVLVGANTVNVDNPRLTARSAGGRNPYRIILDGNLLSSSSSRVFHDTESERTLVFTSTAVAARKKRRVAQLQRLGIQVHWLRPVRGTVLDVHQVLKILAKTGIASVLVEGGANTYAEFIRANAADKLIIFLAPRIMGQGVSAFEFLRGGRLAGARHISIASVWNLKGDLVIEAYLRG